LPVGSAVKEVAKQLVGLPYSPFAQRSQSRHVQCATLVWRLFDKLGKDKVPEGLVLPLNFRASEGLELVYDGF